MRIDGDSGVQPMVQDAKTAAQLQHVDPTLEVNAYNSVTQTTRIDMGLDLQVPAVNNDTMQYSVEGSRTGTMSQDTEFQVAGDSDNTQYAMTRAGVVECGGVPHLTGEEAQRQTQETAAGVAIGSDVSEQHVIQHTRTSTGLVEISGVTQDTSKGAKSPAQETVVLQRVAVGDKTESRAGLMEGGGRAQGSTEETVTQPQAITVGAAVDSDIHVQHTQYIRMGVGSVEDSGVPHMIQDERAGIEQDRMDGITTVTQDYRGETEEDTMDRVTTVSKRGRMEEDTMEGITAVAQDKVTDQDMYRMGRSKLRETEDKMDRMTAVSKRGRMEEDTIDGVTSVTQDKVREQDMYRMGSGKWGETEEDTMDRVTAVTKRGRMVEEDTIDGVTSVVQDKETEQDIDRMGRGKRGETKQDMYKMGAKWKETEQDIYRIGRGKKRGTEQDTYKIDRGKRGETEEDMIYGMTAEDSDVEYKMQYTGGVCSGSGIQSLDQITHGTWKELQNQESVGLEEGESSSGKHSKLRKRIETRRIPRPVYKFEGGRIVKNRDNRWTFLPRIRAPQTRTQNRRFHHRELDESNLMFHNERWERQLIAPFTSRNNSPKFKQEYDDQQSGLLQPAFPPPFCQSEPALTVIERDGDGVSESQIARPGSTGMIFHDSIYEIEESNVEEHSVQSEIYKQQEDDTSQFSESTVTTSSEGLRPQLNLATSSEGLRSVNLPPMTTKRVFRGVRKKLRQVSGVSPAVCSSQSSSDLEMLPTEQERSVIRGARKRLDQDSVFPDRPVFDYNQWLMDQNIQTARKGFVFLSKTGERLEQQLTLPFIVGKNTSTKHTSKPPAAAKKETCKLPALLVPLLNAPDLMLRAYMEATIPRPRPAGPRSPGYRWSEVFPVLRKGEKLSKKGTHPPSSCRGGGRITACVLPKLPPSGRCMLQATSDTMSSSTAGK